MALSRIWASFIIVSILVALIRITATDNKVLFTSMVTGKAGDSVRLNKVDTSILSFAQLRQLDSMHYIQSNNKILVRTGNQLQYIEVQSADGMIETCKSAVNISIGLIGIMALFMGLMTIAEWAGGIRILSKIISPFFSKLFPDIPKNHPSMGHMVMNFSANLLGLDNAATPFGLKTMQSLQELNPNKSVASNAQIMFLCLHASGLTLIPVSIIAARAALKAPDPTDIFVPCMMATFAATVASMIIVSWKQKINLFKPVILLWIGGISVVMSLLVIYLTRLQSDQVQYVSALISNSIILFIFLAIILGALYKKINIFDAFVEGAKGGFETAVRIIPYLVGMLVAISLLRTSGTFDAIINGVKYMFASMGADTRFVDGLPTALIRPLSGGGARGMMIDTIKAHSPNSFAGRLSSILQGSSDTTFYVIAVYFGSVSIKDTRYSLAAMLLADLVGILTSIFLAYLFFGSSK